MTDTSARQRAPFPEVGERRMPAATRAAGWYQLGYSWEFEAGAPPESRRFFGEDWVIYRTEGGELVVNEAHCPHLGAHLGFGGKVCGERLVCPFHGWEWNADGSNAHVPYGPRDSVRNRIAQLVSREIDHQVFAWWDPRGREPFLGLALRTDPSDAELLLPGPAEALVFPNVAYPPQLPLENGVDFAHFKYVHKAEEIGTLDWAGVVDGRFSAVANIGFGGGRPSTWLTPDGPVDGRIITDSYSIGLMVARFEVHEKGRADMLLTIATTPIDDEHSNYYVTVQARDPELAAQWVEQERIQTLRDVVIWENMAYIARPPLVGDETGAMSAIREWSYQFYVPVSEDA